MKLRWSILGVILLTFVGLVSILSISLQGILVPHFREEEVRSVRLNVQRVLGVLENEQVSLTEAARSWASRDETYDYLQTGSPEFIQRNLSDSVLAGFNVDLLIFITPQPQIVHASLAPGSTANPADIPAEMKSHIAAGDSLLRTAADREPRSGLLVTSRGPLLLVSAPVLKTSGAGPAAGTLLVGRYIDDTEIANMASVARLPVEIRSITDSQLPADYQQADQSFTAADPITSLVISETQMAGFGQLKDFYGQPAYILRVEQGRTQNRNSQLVLQYLYMAIIMGALLFFIMTYLVLDRLVLARIRKMGQEVTEIGAGGDLTARVTVDHHDELTRVSKQINGMLTNLQALSHRLVEIQEDERRRIALELHDEIGQLLTGLKLQLGAQNGAESPQPGLEKARGLTDELIQRVRNLSLDLRPTMLDDLGLLPALLWHFDRFKSVTGVNVTFSQNGLLDARFSPELETTVYRIVQEALTNVARHSGVSEASVSVLHLDGVMTIQVEDRGSGFDAAGRLADGRTRGLRGMQERVALVGGSITIDSVPGWGTSILVELPASALPEGEGSANDHSSPGG